MLMGNHEALALGYKLFPDTRFGEVWAINGGHESDQDRLTDEHVEWLRGLPVVARHGDYLLMHSDTTDYLEWGDSVDDINGTYETLRSRGVNFVAPPEQQSWGGSLAHFLDSDGNVLTLLG